MERSTRILIVSRPGHSRQSLVALLKTLHSTELFLTDGNNETASQAPHLILVDLGGLHPLSNEVLKRAAQAWPTARKMVLVADIRRHRRARGFPLPGGSRDRGLRIES